MTPLRATCPLSSRAAQLSVAWPPGPADGAGLPGQLRPSRRVAHADPGTTGSAAADLPPRGRPLRLFCGLAHVGFGWDRERPRRPAVHAGRGRRPLRQTMGVRYWWSPSSPSSSPSRVAASPHLIGTTPRRLFLTGSIAAMLSVAIHTLRGRLLDTSARTARLLHHEKALNAAGACELVQLLGPPQITALGAQLARASRPPRGSEILRASYLRIEDEHGRPRSPVRPRRVGRRGAAGLSRSTLVCARP